MIYKREGSRYYMVKFQYKGETVCKSTGATDAKTARSIAAKIRAELAKGNWGILEKKPAPTLAHFLEKDFLPYVESTAAKLSTARYYGDGVKRLLAPGNDIAGLRLDQITDQHAGQFAARYSCLSPSTVNCALRTLRRALSLAVEWGKLDRMPKIGLVKGERQRERVLTDTEADRYLAACPAPWRDVATIMLGTGMRPAEVRRLRWEHVLLNGHGGLIRIAEGKSKAARRVLPIVPRVYRALKARYEAQGRPLEGWLFPSGSASGHLEESTDKKYHARALENLEKAHKEKPEENPEVKPFEPYCLRHTALTRLAEAGCDAFKLAYIAGHSDIRITQRYVHPDTDAIEAAFLKLAASQKVVTDGGYSQDAENRAEKNVPVTVSP
jgi:integrase